MSEDRDAKFREDLLDDDINDLYDSSEGIPEEDDDEDEIPEESLDYTYRDESKELDFEIIDGISGDEEYPPSEIRRKSPRNPHNSSAVRDAHGDYEKYREESNDEDFDKEAYEESLRDDYENYDDEHEEETEIYVKKYPTVSAFSLGEDGEMIFELDSIINNAIDLGASDIMIQPDKFISYKILGSVYPQSELGVIDDVDVRRAMELGISHVLSRDFTESKELDTSYTVKEGQHAGRRLRLNVAQSFGHNILTFRVINDVIPTPEELDIEEEILEWMNNDAGVFMMCGKTGTGKTTTTASIIDQVRRKERKHILTIEKPIEFEYPKDGLSLVTQREVLTDTHSFSNAMDSAMRMAPDIILVGEVRNAVEVDQFIRASESGHLSISTMHTSSPHGTIQRIAGIYSDSDRRRVLATLSQEAIGLANQLLVLSTDGKRRYAVREILSVKEHNDVKDFIEKGDSRAIKNFQVMHKATIEHKLVEAYREGKCTRKEALTKANDNQLFKAIENGEY